MNYRITIVGCRDYNDYSVFYDFVDNCFRELNLQNGITILSGHCTGVDAMAEKYAVEKGYNLEIYPAEWKKFGKAAGPKRNRIMVEKCDFVIAFWDYKSKGTKSLIDYANKFAKPLKIKEITLP